jgi:U3 small nucleolar RNA-associated protein 6
MAGASDKARFYLEQSVPELKEYERKKIFTTVRYRISLLCSRRLTKVQPEVTSIARKRSDFEHKLNARGSHPSDYARYAEFEVNVDALRRKRVRRLGIKAPAHNGQRRIFFILDRGTRKFPGDIALWMQSIEYARKQKAHKKLLQIFTSVLRLHPTKPDLWIYAAQFAIDAHADMTEARSYMQRGLRFCKNSKKMWLEYAKLEILYIAKIAARRRVLGIDGNRTSEAAADSPDDPNADILMLPKVTKEDINPTLPDHDGVDEAALRTLDSTPAMTGAIPIAVFDAAMAQFRNDPAVGKAFFDLCWDFDNVPCLQRILNHVVEAMMAADPSTWQAQACFTKVAVFGLDVSSPEFPPSLGVSLSRLKSGLSQTPQKVDLAEDLLEWVQGWLEHDHLDPAIHRVLSAKKCSLEQVVHAVKSSEGSTQLKG